MVNSVIWMLIGVAFGGLMMVMFLKGRIASEQMENRHKLLRSEELLHEMEQKYQQSKEEMAAASQRERKIQQEGYERQLNQQKELFTQQLAQLRTDNETQISQLKTANEAQLAQLKTANEEQLASQQKSFESQFEQQRESYEQLIEQQKEAAAKQLSTERRAFEESSLQIKKAHEEAEARVKEECKTIANGILEQNKQALKNENKEQMDGYLVPLKEKLESFSKAVTQANEDGIRRNAELGEKITQMAKSSVNIGEKADKLAEALKNDSKLQGNWGEMSLTRLLEQSGLNQGTDFKTQVMLENEYGSKIKHEESGRRLQPDAVVFIPGKRALVIDSKVSLTAYEEYCNAEEDEKRADALKRHVSSVQKHIDELSVKEYGKYLNECGQSSAGFVLMYIPISGALRLIQQNKPEMVTAAAAKHVCIVDGLMLLPVLHLITMSWQFEAQNRNQQEIVKMAVSLNESLHSLFGKVGDVDKYLLKTREAFDGMALSMHSGRGNLVSKCEKLVQLGCKPAKKCAPLPEALKDKAMETVDEASDDDALSPEKKSA